jgi:uncharacterized protein
VGKPEAVGAVASYTYKQHLPLALALAIACTHRKAVPPTPSTHLTDTVRFLSASTQSDIEAKLTAYEARSKHQFYVWITDSAHGEAYSDFTFRVFNAWGVGRERFDDGVVLFVFVKDDMRWITVGYGLEAAIPDAEAVRICRQVMRPLMQAGKHNEAVSIGVDAVIARIDAWESNR